MNWPIRMSPKHLTDATMESDAVTEKPLFDYNEMTTSLPTEACSPQPK